MFIKPKQDDECWMCWIDLVIIYDFWEVFDPEGRLEVKLFNNIYFPSIYFCAWEAFYSMSFIFCPVLHTLALFSVHLCAMVEIHWLMYCTWVRIWGTLLWYFHCLLYNLYFWFTKCQTEKLHFILQYSVAGIHLTHLCVSVLFGGFFSFQI